MKRNHNNIFFKRKTEKKPTKKRKKKAIFKWRGFAVKVFLKNFYFSKIRIGKQNNYK
jgi:hypothetical protein